MHSRRNGWRRRCPSRVDDDILPSIQEAHGKHSEKKTYGNGRAKNVHCKCRRIIQVGVRPGVRKSLSFGQLELGLAYGWFAVDTNI